MEHAGQATAETWHVHNEADVYAAISAGRMMGNTMGFEHADQMRLETIIAELARNALRYGGGGTVSLRRVQNKSSTGTSRSGLEIIVEDGGPGIANLVDVLANGRNSKSTGNASSGLGVGLAAVRRLADEFEIESVVGHGTRVRVCKWKRVEQDAITKTHGN
ncbi:MAG: ATP-binding protein [Thermoflexales bacterium]|nr:ATP-binding protein [Thermoflexales bacterium]